MMRALAEMAYEFDEPFVLDTTKYEDDLRWGRHPAPTRHRNDGRWLPEQDRRNVSPAHDAASHHGRRGDVCRERGSDRTLTPK